MQPTSSKVTNAPDCSGMKIWITTSDKEPRPAKVLAQGWSYSECVVEDDYKCQLWSQDKLKKQGL